MFDKRCLVLRLVFCTILVWPLAAALSSPPPGVDIIGIYTAPDGTGRDNVDVDGMVDVYLVASGIETELGLCGWECIVGVPGTVFLGGASLVGQAVNVVEPPEFVVGLAEPLFPVNGIVHLATLTFIVPDVVACLWIPCSMLPAPWSPPGVPGYAICGSAEPHALTPSSGACGECIFGFNTGPLGIVTASAPASWGSVKRLYR